MLNTFIMLGLILLLAIILMTDFIILIPKFVSEHFGAPDDIKEMMKKTPDRPVWVNALGVTLLIIGFAGVIAVLIWAITDTVRSDMSFVSIFIRFLIILEGYKLFDIICFDYLMLTKLKLPEKIYPETAGAKGYNNFGFNAKSQMIKIVVFFVISILVAVVITVIAP